MVRRREVNVLTSSAMAAAISDKICSENALSFKADSCGLAAALDASASGGAIQAVKDLYDIDLSLHRSKPVTRQLLDSADIIFAMSQNHAAPILSFPEYRDKVYIASPPISDPYMQDVSVYKECAKELYSQIKALFSKEKSDES